MSVSAARAAAARGSPYGSPVKKKREEEDQCLDAEKYLQNQKQKGLPRWLSWLYRCWIPFHSFMLMTHSFSVKLSKWSLEMHEEMCSWNYTPCDQDRVTRPNCDQPACFLCRKTFLGCTVPRACDVVCSHMICAPRNKCYCFWTFFFGAGHNRPQKSKAAKLVDPSMAVRRRHHPL